MKLLIYKGFDKNFLEQVDGKPLVDGKLDSKINVLLFDKTTRKSLDRALLDLDDEEIWITYQEYSLIKQSVDRAIEEDDLEVLIYINNLYPDYYPIEFDLNEELVKEIRLVLDGKDVKTESQECTNFLKVYNALISVNGKCYGSFSNFEYEKSERVTIANFYPSSKLSENSEKTDFQIFLNDDMETYLENLTSIETINPKSIGIQTTDGEVSKRILNSLLAYCQKNHIIASKYCEELKKDDQQEKELIRIAREDIGIKNFENFRKIKLEFPHIISNYELKFEKAI